MPDRYGDDHMPDYGSDEPWINANAIANCELCDDHGKRGMYVCEHIDYASAAKRGMAMVRAVLGWEPKP